MNWLKYSSPQTFYPMAGKLIPWIAVGAAILIAYGLYIGLLIAPTDAVQGDSYRVIYIHVAAAWLSMFLYVLMAVYAIIGLSLNAKLPYMMATSVAPTGAMFTFVALVTGVFWGRPTWGAWWIPDARLISELILLFLYIGYMSLQAAIDDERRANRASAVLAIIGVINVPIIYFSVKWWNTLHQGSSFSRNSIVDPTILKGMLVMAIGFWLYSIAVILSRTRREIEDKARNAARLNELRE